MRTITPYREYIVIDRIRIFPGEFAGYTKLNRWLYNGSGLN